MARQLIFDAWTPMSFKRALGNRRQPGIDYEHPTWVGADNQRRLAAYKILQAYLDNAARHFLATQDETVIDQHREYGDAALLRDTILSALLGEEQTIIVPGAADSSSADSEDPGDSDPDADAKQELQDWLRDLWDLERGPLKLQETERDAVGLGDGVYTLGWSPEKGRTRIRVWDPGFYFPVLHDGNEDDYPEKVHIAWEVPPEDWKDPNRKEIRRLTWEIVDLPDGETRSYPWNDEPTTRTCLHTDGIFLISTGNITVSDLDPNGARYATDEDGNEIRNLDLRIDFVPVIHVPNTVAIKEHFGRSSLSTVLQILDDLANADTDLQAASATAARPVMGLKGASLGKKAPSYNPGEVWETGEGELYTLDTSKSLDALKLYVDSLLERLSVSGRTPDALLGRVKPSEVPSGLALALSFGPLAAMVTSMRLSRAEKYPLLLKFMWRVAVSGGQADAPAAWFPADLELGSYLPQDRAGVVALVTQLLGGPNQRAAISYQTAIAMLMSAGIPIEDANEEIARIKGQDFVGAGQLHDATGSADAVFEYLDMNKPEDVANPPAPPPVIPPGQEQLPGQPAPAAPAQPSAAPPAPNA